MNGLAHRLAPWPSRGAAMAAAMVAVACLVGAAIPVLASPLLMVGLVACLVVVAVVVYPSVGAYVLLGVTPLVAGMDRGLVIPVLRPNEAVLALVAGGLTVRGVVRVASGSLPRPTVNSTDISIIVLAVASSVVPLAWLMARGAAIGEDDVLYALMIWKYYGVYLVARAGVRTERQVRICLWIAMASASVVAMVAVLQSLQLFGVARALATYYAPYGSAGALLNNRGGSTLALPIAVADLMTFNLAIAVGLLVRRIGPRWLLASLATLFMVGVLASGQFSGAIGLLLGLVVMALVIRRVRQLAMFIPVVIGAMVGLQPVIQRRLEGFETASGLPVSWTGRLYNLSNYFWPELFSSGNFILGVRPAARVATSTMATGYIWIESGYTWLLWAGGIPLLLSFLYFLWTNLRRSITLARSREDAVGAVSLAVVVALVVVGVLMLIDPHLTYRGSADLLFALLGLLAVADAPQATGREPLEAMDVR